MTDLSKVVRIHVCWAGSYDNCLMGSLPVWPCVFVWHRCLEFSVSSSILHEKRKSEEKLKETPLSVSSSAVILGDFYVVFLFCNDGLSFISQLNF